jgi:hypothetical protein
MNTGNLSMKLDHRVLLPLAQPVLSGSDMDRLHDELSQLGDPYRPLVRRDVDADGARQFGEGFRRAVTIFQEQDLRRLQEVVAGSLDGTESVRWPAAWGRVDPATAHVMWSARRYGRARETIDYSASGQEQP